MPFATNYFLVIDDESTQIVRYHWSQCIKFQYTHVQWGIRLHKTHFGSIILNPVIWIDRSCICYFALTTAIDWDKQHALCRENIRPHGLVLWSKIPMSQHAFVNFATLNKLKWVEQHWYIPRSHVSWVCFSIKTECANRYHDMYPNDWLNA